MSIDIRDYPPDATLEVKIVVVVAKKGGGPDWAAYYAPLPDEHGELPEDMVKGVVTYGEKLPEEVAKYHFFPNIGGGPYRA